MLQRPQPLGVFPYPAGLLLLPPGSSELATEAREALMAGRVPETLPADWSFFRAALEDAPARAIALLGDDDSALANYNRFVLAGSAIALSKVRQSGNRELIALAELAAYVQGATQSPPDAPGLDTELRANLMLARAAWCLERDDAGQAIAAIDDGLLACEQVSPLLGAQLAMQRAQLCATEDPEAALAAWQRACTLAADTPLHRLRADAALGYAIALHESAGDVRTTLVEAVKWYQQALHAGIDVESAPEAYALIQANLGLAYAAMPMSTQGEKLRLAVSVQAFREALKVYTRESHPEQWASVCLNMANALQYMPSGHQQENLMEAVNVYEELMTVRTRAFDPVGYARLLANQGNALAHLGMFAPSLEKLHEAHKLLHWHGEGTAAQSLLEQVERINQQIMEQA
jgi:tetratricopeptide (TPR) repeat protein